MHHTSGGDSLTERKREIPNNICLVLQIHIKKIFYFLKINDFNKILDTLPNIQGVSKQVRKIPKGDS